MLISATGSSRFARDAGVSLIEAMIALMVVSLLAGAVVLTLPGRERLVGEEADRLGARLMLAGEESVIANRSIALALNENGYGFERFEDGQWIAAESGSPLAYRAWPGALTAEVEANELGDNARHAARFDAWGGVGVTSIVLDENGVRWRVAVTREGAVRVARAE